MDRKEHEPRHTWTAKGRHAKNIGGHRAAADKIDIEEVPHSFRMDDEGSTDPYGVAITPRGAVDLIARLVRVLKKAGMPPVLPLPMPPEGAIENLPQDQIKDAILLRMISSFGMTFDRSILLKIISQPTCEGIRFYPCLKMVDGTEYLSLVLVGVNDQGEDLHFKGSDATSFDEDGKASVTSKSLLSEYAHPPTVRLAEDIKHHLLQIAISVAGPATTATNTGQSQ